MKATQLLHLTKKLDMILQEIDDIKYGILQLSIEQYKNLKEEEDEQV